MSAVLPVLVVALVLSPLSVAGLPTLASVAQHIPGLSQERSPANLPGSGSFSFVANFEDGGFDGWVPSGGGASVVSKPNYLGEPSLRSIASGGPQVDLAGRTSGVLPGASTVSFQAAVNPGKGVGFVGLADGSGNPVAVVGVGSGEVWAGTAPASAAVVGPVPNGTAQPSGWVYVVANVYPVSTGSKTPPTWVMDVFVDRTDQLAASRVPVPAAGGYASGLLETTQATVYYTNTIVTSYEIASLVPGYNNMDGYGQGSGLTVELLPTFTTLTGTMTVADWNVPQGGILSFQINAMNYYGTTRSSCKGFFQLGVDLDPNGQVAPWYVPGSNCVAHYFLNSNNPAVGSGFPTPNGSQLLLTIQDQTGAKQVFFQIVDTAAGIPAGDRYWNATVPYNGTLFYGTYTQIEWQPCCSSSPISSYFFNGSLANLAVSGGQFANPELLASPYMLPFALDMPPSWNLGYYDDSSGGYSQVG